MKPTDFSKMTDQEIRMWIAARLGWTDLRVNQSYPRIISGTPPNAKERVVRAGFTVVTSVEQENTPNWPASSPSALELPGIGPMWTLDISIGWEMVEATLDDGARSYHAMKDIDAGDRANGARVARVICEAWAQMMEAQS